MVAYIFVVACLFMATFSGCAALDYTVGDAAGWGLGVDLSSWTAGKIFTVGDNLVFTYNPGHTVAEVSLEDYTSCTVGNSIATHNSGSTEIPLDTPGTHYFICTVTNHCAAGMKLAIPVSHPPTPPAGGSAVPQMVHNDASSTPLSYGILALLFLLLGISL